MFVGLNRVWAYGLNLIKHFLGIRNRFPQILSYLITNECNSHCITCGVWRETDIKGISNEDLVLALESSLFHKIKHVGISGGEPSLCPNLRSQIGIIIDKLHELQSVSITSNCINSLFWEENLIPIKDLCTRQKVRFQLNISVDGVGMMHDAIRGTKGNFEQMQQVVAFCKANSIPYQLHSTINRHNVYQANRLLKYAEFTSSDIIFRLASPIARLENQAQVFRVSLDKKQQSYICDFFSSSLLNCHTKSVGRKLFYKELVAQMLGDMKRTAPCHFQQNGIVLSSDGTISFCSRFETPFSHIKDSGSVEKFQSKSIFEACNDSACNYCYHDQSGLWPLSKLLKLKIEPQIDKASKVAYLLRELPNLFFSIKTSTKCVVKKVSIIGMYGGGHVGDAAILGGCIFRLYKRYGDIEAISIYSIRKDRTECWVDNLKRLPAYIKINVFDKESEFINQLETTDLLLWAGGPIMEIPTLLTKHLSIIQRNNKLGNRFEMEGVGYGPINSILCKRVSNKIFKTADKISVRSLKDKDSLMNYKIDDTDIYDPAFDYLSLLDGKELILSSTAKNQIDKLIDEKRFVALNLRPLWSKYGDSKLFDYNAFLNQISQIVDYLASKDIYTIFFPMNADQFGFSDLSVAYDLEQKITKKAHYKIWETEPTIEDVVYLLREAECSICMRFHAVIFSLSQKIETIGIDYSLKGKGKVSTLLDETRCFKITDFNSKSVIQALGI